MSSIPDLSPISAATSTSPRSIPIIGGEFVTALERIYPESRVTARQLRLLDLLAPHLRRAFRLHRTVWAERASAGAAQAAFDHWAHAALVLNSSARVVTFNLAAESLLKRADGLWFGRRATLHRRRNEDAGAADRDSQMRRDRGWRARGRTRRHHAAAPIGRGAAARHDEAAAVMVGLSDGRGAVLAVVLDPTQAPHTPVAWLAKQFGLSPAECRLTEVRAAAPAPRHHQLLAFIRQGRVRAAASSRSPG